MKGSEAQLLSFMEGKDKRFVIPIYQRKYDWKNDNCRQLYDDLKKVIDNNLTSHFFGSIVSQAVVKPDKTEYYIIDGQQRITTITLLLIAICNVVRDKKIIPDKDNLENEI